MSVTKLTSSDVRNLNCSSVFSEVYALAEASKQELATRLRLSMPTVNQNLKKMADENLIIDGGAYDSTGGRRPQIIRFNQCAKIAIGVELLKKQIRIVAIDLYGNILGEDLYKCQLSFDQDSVQYMADRIHALVESLQVSEENVLGVKFAFQGLSSPDGTTVVYSKIYSSAGLSSQELQKYIKFPCSLIHDTESSAFAELWFRPEIRDAVFFMLNREFGGTLIINRVVYQGKEFTSGTIEHLCLDPNGPVCYCGNRGCFHTYFSTDVLKQRAGMELEIFFQKLRNGNSFCQTVWHDYLEQFAFAINKIRMLIDCDFIFGGYLLPRITDSDIHALEQMVQQNCAFRSENFHILRGYCGAKAPAIGAALLLVKQFLTDSGFNMEHCSRRFSQN